MKKVILKIEGMTCSACSSSLEKYLLKQKGIDDALVNLVMSSASISYEDDITIDDLNKFVSEAGFKSLGIYNEKDDTTDNKNIYFIINGVLALLVLYISMAHMLNLPVIPFLHMVNHPINYSVCLFLFSLYFIYFGRDVIISGIKNIKYKSPNMDTLVTLGVISSFLFSTFNMIMILKHHNEYVENLYFESVSIILYLIKFGRYIDSISKEKTKDAIKGLVTITPNKATLFTNNKEKEVSIPLDPNSAELVDKILLLAAYEEKKRESSISELKADLRVLSSSLKSKYTSLKNIEKYKEELASFATYLAGLGANSRSDFDITEKMHIINAIEKLASARIKGFDVDISNLNSDIEELCMKIRKIQMQIRKQEEAVSHVTETKEYLSGKSK